MSDGGVRYFADAERGVAVRVTDGPEDLLETMRQVYPGLERVDRERWREVKRKHEGRHPRPELVPSERESP